MNLARETMIFFLICKKIRFMIKKILKNVRIMHVINWALNIILIGCAGIGIWLLLIVTTFSSFKVPTGSMEPTILPGDYILVNKWLVGARVFDV